MVKNEILQDYLFHYNPYTGKWNGFTRDNLIKYFGPNPKEAKVIEGASTSEIIQKIMGGNK